MTESPMHAASPVQAASQGHASRSRQYLTIFFVLFVLTVLEVAVAYVHGHKVEIVVALFSLALVKAACVALFFMHLKWETRILKATVVVPLCFPVLYALVLITEGAWRRLGG